MNFRACVLLALLALAPLAARATDTPARFSLRLSDAERTSAGLTRLDSDQVAVLDALVRRDLAADRTHAALTFSQRLSPDEYRNAGLAALNALELVRLDSLVATIEDAGSASSLSSATASLSTAAPLTGVSFDRSARAPEIHGELSLGFGGGKGFSTRCGSLVLTVSDPDQRTSLTVGYATRRIDLH